MILTEDKVNLNRQREFDLLKALSIIAMIITHVYEEISVVDISIPYTTPFDVFLQFLGASIGPPFLMFAMGIGISYSRHRSPRELFLRGLKLFVFSYVLNLIRSTIPYSIGCISGSIDFNYDLFIYITFNVDILNFAGLAFILFALLKKLEVPPLGVCAIALIMQAVGQLIVSVISFDSMLLKYVFAPFVKTDYFSYFPLFLWFIFPALGLLFAKYLRHITDLDKFYRAIFVIASATLVAFCTTLYIIKYDIRNLYMLANEAVYDKHFLHDVFSICCVLIEVSAAHFILKKVHLPKIEKTINYVSSNLNNIYIIQWLLIAWLSFTVFTEGHKLETPWIVPVGLMILIASCLIVKLYQKIFKRQNIL